MRQIKFRAWVEIGDNAEVTGMVYGVVPYDYTHDGNIGCFTEAFNEGIKPSGYQYSSGELIPDDKEKGTIDGDEFNLRDFEDDWVWFDGELMQFTGLLDKNGKEIYEGDLVRIQNYNYQHLEKDLYEIYYDAESIRFKLRNNKKFPKDADHDTDGFHSFDVVGNIFENPGLQKL